MSGLFDEEETNELQLYVNDVEKSLLFYKNNCFKVVDPNGYLLRVTYKKGKHEKCLPFLWKYSKNEPFLGSSV